MVKSYLRYDAEKAVGVICTRDCNVQWDRTGKIALTGCVDAVGLWNLRQGTQARALKVSGSRNRVSRICVHRRQPLCAVGYSDGSVRIWNYEENTSQQTLQGHRSAISCLAFDEESGNLLASGGCDTDIVLWDLILESGVARLRGHVDQVTAIVFWGHSSLVGAASSAADGRGGEAGVAGPELRIISASKDRLIRIWSVELQLCLQTLAENQMEVWSLAMNASQSRLVCGSSDKFLRVWSLRPDATGTEEDPFATHMGEIPRTHGQGNAIGLEFARPQQLDFEILLCQGSGKTIELFRFFEGKEVTRRQQRRQKRVLAKKQKAASKKTKKNGGLVFEEDSDEGTAGPQKDDEDQDAEIEEPANDENVGPRAADELAALMVHTCGTKLQSFSWSVKTSSVLLALGNNTMESIHLAKGEEVGSVKLEKQHEVSLPGHRTGIRSLAVAVDDSLVMSTSAEAVKIWNASVGSCVRTMASGYGLCGIFLAGNEHVLVGTKEGNLELFDLRIAELADKLEAHSGAVYGIAERPDREGCATCSADKHVRFFEFSFTASGERSCTVTEVPERATELPDEGLALAYSPDGKYLAIALLNHFVQVMFADSLKFNLSLYGHKLPVMSLDIASDSQMVASGSADKNIKLWSTQFGNCLRSLRAHNESVMQVRFMPGTHYLVSASRDNEVKLWDCDSYEHITTLQGHSSEVLALALSKDAAFIVTGSSDRQIRFWKRTQEQLFLSEEREKELEQRFEGEVEREDLQKSTMAPIVSLRPSRRTVESIRSTEQLMDVLARAAGDTDDTFDLDGQPPCMQVVRYINTLTASNIYEVLLALPFTHAMKLLRFLCDFFEAVAILPEKAEVATQGGAEAQALVAASLLETPCQAALITTYVHHQELAVTTQARELLLRLRKYMRMFLQAEKDCIGMNIAGFAHLQRVLKRSSGISFGEPTPKATAKGGSGRGRGRGRGDGAASRPAKKRRAGRGT